jgi:hypothetical protein
MQIGPLIGSGRTADVFAINDAWVLRRYRDGRDASAEASVMAYLFNRGYPVPRVAPNAGSELTMERLHGQTMVEALPQSRISPQEAGAISGAHPSPVQASEQPSQCAGGQPYRAE